MRERILKLKPGYVPVVFESGDRDSVKGEVVSKLEKNRFLLPGDFTGAQVYCALRRRLSLDSKQAVFVMVQDCLVSHRATVQELQQRYGDSQDGFLYLTYTYENTFG